MKNKSLPAANLAAKPYRIGARAAAACRQRHRCARRLFDRPTPTTPRQSWRRRNVTLTAAQRQNIHLYTVAPSKFHKTIETTGAVDFDNDQATSVLAPFSGPVSRLLVSPGDQVKKGDPLAVVDSPDFAAAISAYRKALATARTDRRLADLDKDLLQHNGVAQREADAGGNRCRQRRGRPRRRPAGTRVAECRSADHQGHSGGPAGLRASRA